MVFPFTLSVEIRRDSLNIEYLKKNNIPKCSHQNLLNIIERYDGELLVCGMYSTSFFPSSTLKINL